MTETAAWALALEALPGIGRVTAGRLVTHFSTYERLLQTPREQVLVRIKGAPNAEALVKRLFDEPAVRAGLAAARSALEAMAARRIGVVVQGEPGWPAGLDDLARSDRPLALYLYGDARLLAEPSVAFLNRPPVEAAHYGLAEALARHLLEHGLRVAGGIAHGFDVSIHRLCAGSPGRRASLLVTHAGLSRLEKSLRPTVSLAVRAGGLFLSPFPPRHGPFEHDDFERALVQTALARAAVFFDPRPDTPEWRALAWALERGRPVFGTPAPGVPLPEGVHPLQDPVDYDWVVQSSRFDVQG